MDRYPVLWHKGLEFAPLLCAKRTPLDVQASYGSEGGRLAFELPQLRQPGSYATGFASRAPSMGLQRDLNHGSLFWRWLVEQVIHNGFVRIPN